jgi:O-antigen/teichoic acid export membrane protein
MQKKFVSNLILIIILNLLVKPFAIFAIDAQVQDRVGTEAYGLYFSLLNLSFLFNIVADLGINNYTTKNVAQYPHIVSRYIGKIFSFRLILFALYGILTMAIGVGIGYRGEELWFLAVLVFNQLLVTLIAYFRSHFGGLHLFKTDALVSILDRGLLILICGYLLISTVNSGDFRIEWFIYIQTICYAVTLIVAFLLLTARIGLPRFHFDWVFSLAILRKSYPYALLILLMMIYTRTDSVMLERLHPNGQYESGIYAKGFRFFDAFFMFAMIFANLLLPIFARLLKGDRSRIEPILRTSRDLLLGGSIVIAFACMLDAESILGLLYRTDVAQTAPSFHFIMWGFVGVSISIIYGTLLTAGGDLSFLNRISAVGIVINVIFNALLIPEYGAAGSAFATLVTQAFTSVVQAVYCHRKFSIPFSVSEMISYALFIGILIACTAMFPKGNNYLLLLLFIGALGMITLKLIDVRGLRKAFKENL